MTRRPNDHDMEQAVRSWMRDDEDHPADRNRQVGRIMGRVDETRQRRGAWRLLPFWRSSRPIDEADDDLYTARRGGLAPSFMALVAVLALMVTSLVFLALRPDGAGLIPGAGPLQSASPPPMLDPADAALFARYEGIRSGSRTSLEDVSEVYAEDAISTLLWHDDVDRALGQHDIWQRIQQARNVDAGYWIRLPDVILGPRAPARRYLGVRQDLGGIACVFWIRDERITRHDCILPTGSTDPAASAFQPAAPDTLEVWEAIKPDFNAGWAGSDPELIARTVSPDVVHHVAMDNHAYTLTGIDAYLSIMGGEAEEQAPPVALPAPEGEVRWTDFSSVGGGSLCTFWARDGLLVRHDCIVPSRQMGTPAPATPAPAGT